MYNTMTKKTGRELIAEIKKQRADYNHWHNKEVLARMRKKDIARQIISTSKTLPPKDRELYNEKLSKLLKGLEA